MDRVEMTAVVGLTRRRTGTQDNLDAARINSERDAGPAWHLVWVTYTGPLSPPVSLSFPLCGPSPVIGASLGT